MMELKMCDVVIRAGVSILPLKLNEYKDCPEEDVSYQADADVESKIWNVLKNSDIDIKDKRKMLDVIVSEFRKMIDAKIEYHRNDQ